MTKFSSIVFCILLLTSVACAGEPPHWRNRWESVIANFQGASTLSLSVTASEIVTPKELPKRIQGHTRSCSAVIQIAKPDKASATTYTDGGHLVSTITLNSGTFEERKGGDILYTRASTMREAIDHDQLLWILPGRRTPLTMLLAEDARTRWFDRSQIRWVATKSEGDGDFDILEMEDPEERVWELWVTHEGEPRLYKVARKSTEKVETIAAALPGDANTEEDPTGLLGGNVTRAIIEVDIELVLRIENYAFSEMIKDEVFHVQKKVPRPLQSGDMAPRLELPLLSGGVFKIDDYRGSPLIVTFWFTQCSPCVIEIPLIAKLLVDEHLDFALIAVNHQQSAEEVTKFLEVKKWPVLVPLDQRGVVATEWSVYGFPTTYIVDRKGRIVFRGNPLDELDRADFVRTLRSL